MLYTTVVVVIELCLIKTFVVFVVVVVLMFEKML